MELPQELLDEIALEEVRALVDGLHDKEMRKNPAFLEKVRKFLAQNKLQTSPEIEGIKDIKRSTEEIPTFQMLPVAR